MRATVLTETLQKKLSFVSRAISSKNQLPILSAVFIETEGNNICLRTTDLEIGLETTFPAEIIEEGSVAVPAKLFLELANALPQEKITLFTKETNLHVLGTKIKAQLPLMPKEEFPVLYEEKGGKVFSLPGKEFKKIFSKVVFATSPETTRPALSGIYVKQTEEVTTIVATDGYRLSLNSIQGEKFNITKPVIVPARLIREAFVLGEEGLIEFYLLDREKQVLFVQGNEILIGRLIDAEFPKYEKIIPAELSTKAIMDRETLLRGVKTCAIFAREAANVIIFSIKKDVVVVSAKAPTEENTVDVEAQVNGETNAIAMNAKYILDLLSNIQEEQVVLEMSGPLNPAIFSSPQAPHFLHMIMPIRT